MEKVPSFANFVVVGETLYKIVPQSPTHFVGDKTVFLLAVGGDNANRLINLVIHIPIVVNECLLCQGENI